MKRSSAAIGRVRLKFRLVLLECSGFAELLAPVNVYGYKVGESWRPTPASRQERLMEYVPRLTEWALKLGNMLHRRSAKI